MDFHQTWYVHWYYEGFGLELLMSKHLSIFDSYLPTIK